MTIEAIVDSVHRLLCKRRKEYRFYLRDFDILVYYQDRRIGSINFWDDEIIILHIDTSVKYEDYTDKLFLTRFDDAVIIMLYLYGFLKRKEEAEGDGDP